MPLGFQRLNVRKSQPNPNIVFIKPLKGPDEKVAQDFLERIAAQCLPVMREHHLYVTALEEYEPNREFVGRNFNAGEVVQLVLKSPRTGRWLPFDYVQMVMMHELAHCKQMNHSRAFWAVRNSYAALMQGLWSKGYTGDGIWGRGAKLATGEWERNTVRADEVLPEHLCGGTYRSRERKRKVKPTLTYQERKERRVLKKFGKNGQAVGADEDTKVKLEKGKRVQGKPRVAGSARGRELRAAAALARFEQQKDEKPKDEDETVSESESEYEDELLDQDRKDAVDIDGTKLTDGKGRGMVKVCEDEDADDPGARDELDELQSMLRTRIKRESPEGELTSAPLSKPPARVKPEPQEDEPGVTMPATVKDENSDTGEFLDPSHGNIQRGPDPEPQEREASAASTTSAPAQTIDGQVDKTTTCRMCSFVNPPLVVVCTMCANVLDPATAPHSWKCNNDSCRTTLYRNSGDCGICGLCGRRKDVGA